MLSENRLQLPGLRFYSTNTEIGIYSQRQAHQFHVLTVLMCIGPWRALKRRAPLGDAIKRNQL